MKIGIDARFFNESGVGRYLRNLISNLSEIDKKNEYYILLLQKDFNNFNESKNFHKIQADFKWYGFAEQFKLPKLLKQLKLDLVHFPHFNVPVFYTGKFIVTIHDLIHQHRNMSRATLLNPVAFRIKLAGYRKVFKSAILKSRRILAPSLFVKQQLIDEWNVSGDKITVTHEAVDDNILAIRKKIKEVVPRRVLKKFKISQPYIFYVGNAHPHKNIEGLIKAFLILQRKNKNLKLVLSGYDHFFWQRLQKENKHEGIIYTGFISDEELVVLYKEAPVFVLPSFEEGFGIPVLEAMACGTAVVSSKAGSLLEVGGEACLYFDPAKEADMAEKISRILDSENLRKQLIEKGLKRYKQFSWRKLAEKTLEDYQKCV